MYTPRTYTQVYGGKKNKTFLLVSNVLSISSCCAEHAKVESFVLAGMRRTGTRLRGIGTLSRPVTGMLGFKKRFALKTKRMQGTERVQVQHEAFVHGIRHHQYRTLSARSVCSVHHHGANGYLYIHYRPWCIGAR